MKCKSNECLVMGDDAIGNGPWVDWREDKKKKSKEEASLEEFKINNDRVEGFVYFILGE